MQALCEIGKVDLKCPDNSGRTPLWIAACNGHEKVVQMPYETGKIDLKYLNRYEPSPLWAAARYGHEKVV